MHTVQAFPSPLSGSESSLVNQATQAKHERGQTYLVCGQTSQMFR